MLNPRLTFTAWLYQTAPAWLFKDLLSARLSFLRALAREGLLWHSVDEPIRLCCDCHGEIGGQQCSEDGDYLDVCDGCGNVEQSTYEVSYEEYARMD